MPLAKPYPPTPVGYLDWDDLADNYAGKAATLIIDASGKGDYVSIQEAVDALGAVADAQSRELEEGARRIRG